MQNVESGPKESNAAAGVGDRCANCGEVLFGSFCSCCGQRSFGSTPPFREFVAEVLRHFLLLDFRLVHSIRALIVPGLLTELYFRGKRVPFLSPLQVFLTTGIFLLLLLAYASKIQVDAITPDTSLIDDLVFLSQKHRVTFMMVILLLVPLFAAASKALHSRWLYMEHLVFACHVHAFGFFITSLVVIASFFGLDVEGVLLFFLCIALYLFIYTYLAMRRIFVLGWLATGIRWLPLVLGHVLITSVLFFLLVVIFLT